ncbi:MAG: DMT family transporter [Bacteroidia bacterium]
MKVPLRSLILLHVIVFIWGFSPILGRYITIPVWPLIWYRIAITVTALFIIMLWKGTSFKISIRALAELSLIGICILIHWLCFYGAIKVSNVSITMVSFSTGTLFSALIEPVFYKRKLRLYEVLIGVIIIAAILLIFSFESGYYLGILLGVSAAATSSVFGVWNGIIAKRLPSLVITLYELSAALMGLTLYIIFTDQMHLSFFKLDKPSITGLLILSLVCTVYPFVEAVKLTRIISPYTITLTVNLETVYGILWAILIYHENQELSFAFYIGVLMILTSIFLNAWLKQKLNPHVLDSNTL